MSTDTFRRSQAAARPPARRQPPTASVYWRRRFVVLLVGLVLSAAVGWASQHAFRRGAAPGKVAARAAAAAQRGNTGPAGSAGTAGRGLTTGSSVARAGRRATLSGCSPARVVLSLFAVQDALTTGKSAEFQVDVVSMAARPCTFDIGAAHIVLSISAPGTVIWTSAECAEGEASTAARLHPGVPAVIPMTWNGRYATPGCPTLSPPARPGTYTAIATDGSLTSNSLAFSLG